VIYLEPDIYHAESASAPVPASAPPATAPPAVA
jgi:hypothetical protein